MICGRILADTSEIHRLSSLDVGNYAVAPSLGFLRLRLKFSSHLRASPDVKKQSKSKLYFTKQPILNNFI